MELVPPLGDHKYVKGNVPPAGVTVAVPSEEEQVAGVELVVAVSPPVELTFTVVVPLHPTASVIVTV